MSDEAMKALDEIETMMKHAVVFISSREKMHPDGVGLYLQALSLLPTLRAALTPSAGRCFECDGDLTIACLACACPAPPADDEIGAIRARHEAASKFVIPTVWVAQMHTDRATLLRAVDRLSAELAKERERRVEVDCWQPIETAPKDGTRVLVWSVPIANYYNADEPPHVAIAYWLERRPNEIRMGFHSGWVWHGMAGCTFTHWQPIPTPPATLPKDTP